MKKLISFILILSCSTLLGCSNKVQPGDYDSAEVGKVKKVVPGVILSKRPVNIHNKPAESLSAAPNSTDETSDNSMNRSHGYEYVVKLNNGSIISIVQTEDSNLKTKQHILVIYGNNTRIVADEGSDD